LVFVDFDTDNGSLVLRYLEHFFLVVGFDAERLEPLPSVSIIETQGENVVVNQYASDQVSLTTDAVGDYVYSGTLKHSRNETEIDISLVLNSAVIEGGSSALTVSGTDATVIGDLGTATYVQLRDMINNHPEVTRLILQESSGSVNDAINVHTGRLVRNANLTTHVPADGDINSGAVDLFAAGVQRTVEEGGKLGVHAWCCKDGVAADQLPRNDTAHGTQLTYFREMLPTTGVDFYFFTLEAAPFDGIHVMTQEERVRYKLVSE